MQAHFVYWKTKYIEWSWKQGLERLCCIFSVIVAMLLFSKSSSPHKNPNTNKQQTSKRLTPLLSWLPSSLNFISVWRRVLAHSHPTQPGRSCQPREILGCTWLQMQLPWCCYGRCQTAVAWVRHTSDALAAYTLKGVGYARKNGPDMCLPKLSQKCTRIWECAK